MPRRNGRRNVFSGPWRGINQRIPKALLPMGWLSDAQNVDNYGDCLRPRGGYAEFSRATVTPTDKVLSMYGHPIAGEADVFLMQALRSSTIADYFVMNSGGTDWEALTYKTGTGAYDWSNPSLNGQPSGATNPIIKVGRATHFTAGNWTLIMAPDSPVMAYRRISGTHYFRRAGYAFGPTTPSNVTPSASPDREGPSVSGISSAATGGLTSSATYKYLFTWFENTYSQLESNVGSLALTVTTGAGHNTIDLYFAGSSTVVNPKGWPANYFGSGSGTKTEIFASQMRIYRTLANGTEYHAIAEVDFGATTYQDNFSDAQILAGAAPPTDRDAPPENIVCGCYARNRAFYVPKDSNVVWYSKADLADTGRAGVEYVPTTNFFTIPTDDYITGCVAYGQNVLIFKKSSVWMVDTSPLQDDGTQNPNIYQLENAGGAAAPHVIATSEPRPDALPKVYYANTQGAYEFSGQAARMLTEDIPIEWLLLSSSDWAIASAAWDPHHKQYRLAAKRTGDSGVYRMYVFSPDAGPGGSWQFWFVQFNQIRSMAVITRGPSGAPYTDKPLFYTGTDDGKVSWWSLPGSEILTDNGQAIPWFAETGHISSGDPTLLKRGLDVTVAVEASNNATLDMTPYIDDDTSAAKTAGSYLFSSGEPRIAFMHLGGRGRKLKLRFSRSSVAAQLRILSVAINAAWRGIRG